jgi:glycosyltransferase involved in cell wall biosynthesis
MAFVFPSLHETFGLPILEAMSCGCPVISSDQTACPEIVGDAGLLVDPRSVAQIRKAMQTIIEDVELRRELADRGLRRANSFTWRESARQHIDVFSRFVHVGSTGL